MKFQISVTLIFWVKIQEDILCGWFASSISPTPFHSPLFHNLTTDITLTAIAAVHLQNRVAVYVAIQRIHRMHSSSTFYVFASRTETKIAATHLWCTYMQVSILHLVVE